jgi:hypothetical protein
VRPRTPLSTRCCRTVEMLRPHPSTGNIISKGSLTSPNVYESLGETYHRAGITLKLGRVPVYFLGKYVLNISLIVLMALATLVFDNGSENGFAVPVACFMGIVSWMFVLAAQIPVLGYNTRLDDFMAASYLTVFLVVLFSCYRIKRSRNPKPDDSSSSTVVPYTASDAKHNAGDAKVQVEQAKRSSPGRCSRCFSCCFHWIFHPILIHVRPSSRLPPPTPLLLVPHASLSSSFASAGRASLSSSCIGGCRLFKMQSGDGRHALCACNCAIAHI